MTLTTTDPERRRHLAPVDDPEEQLPPHDIAAEQVVVGSAILDRRVIGQISELITPLDLFRPAHQTILQTVLDMDAEGRQLGVVAVSAELTKRGEITQVGGAPYLHTLTEAVPVAINGPYYAAIVADLAAKRRLVDAGTRIAQIGMQGTGEVADLQERADATLRQAISGGVSTESDTELLGDDEGWIDSLAEPIDQSAFVPTPYMDLNEALSGGLRKGELICVAGRTGGGKSTAALDMARSAAIHHRAGTLYISLEMPALQVRERVYAAEARVPHRAIREHDLTEDDWQRIARVRPTIVDAPLWIATPATCTIPWIRQRMQTMERRGTPVRLLVVDHVGLMSSAGRTENRYNEVSAYARGLKLIAMEFDVPVLMLCQVSRAAGRRDDAIPRISDLRDSGELEQSSDLVLIVHRPDYDVTDKAAGHARSGEVDLYIAKNRSGPQCVVTIAAQSHYTRFVDMARG
ncbi:replicative DNA helicase [Marinitenerispora sediminis]|uniref:DNA 5'-3' helicase n=1 Tax=Marinitenerispora sediminis TaxID=1931232 RepID=A0A368T744_9ACTN|nr:DnaB-like helicase C-terminal domain-containing protein [Marinitenerispora sediminis]RCV53492.1 replicative DNA helicase [Marinitenerispora sediminis]RCV59320.1 replicative DNA helicase [Marinitenerispora sediminis]